MGMLSGVSRAKVMPFHTHIIMPDAGQRLGVPGQLSLETCWAGLLVWALGQQR